VYLFGGRDKSGLVKNDLKLIKPYVKNGKVYAVEWPTIQQLGKPPCPRIGHTMNFLPINNALIVAGGRNDVLCKGLTTPFLDDLHVFLLDQKCWLRV
jgi:hypothetical protein